MWFHEKSSSQCCEKISGQFHPALNSYPKEFYFTIVCSLKPIEANYCSNPFGIFFLKNMPGLWPNLSVEIFMEVHFYNHVNKSTFKSSLISGIYENVSILFCVVLVNQGTSEYAFINMIVNLHLQL